MSLSGKLTPDSLNQGICKDTVYFNPILPGGGGKIRPPPVFPPQKSEKSAICRDIELKFGIGTNFGPLSSKTTIKFQSGVNLTLL